MINKLFLFLIVFTFLTVFMYLSIESNLWEHEEKHEDYLYERIAETVVVNYQKLDPHYKRMTVRHNRTCDQLKPMAVHTMINYLRSGNHKVDERMVVFYNNTKENYGFRGVEFPTFTFGKQMDTIVDLSIIIASRNDNYGNNSLLRLINTMEQLTLFNWNINVELIIVEWKPVEPYLFHTDIMKDLLAKSLSVLVKFIQVPDKYAELPNYFGKTCNFFEYVAKNVGMRRAKGTWVLTTNIDDVYPVPLMEYIDIGIGRSLLDPGDSTHVLEGALKPTYQGAF